jgi:hypothetical protein
MAPMARGVADAEENGFVFFLRSRQSFFSPGVPIHWVMSVLQKIRARFVNQPVRLFMLHPDTLIVFITIRMENDKKNPLAVSV